MKKQYFNTCSHDSNPVPYNNRYIGLEIETLNGSRRWTGKYWVYYSKQKCLFCGKETVLSKRTKHNSDIFCSPDCKFQSYLKQTDIKQFRIMENMDDNFYYLIGLIASDGYIKYPKHPQTCKNYACTIELNQKDKYLLENLQQNYGGSINFRQQKQSYIWNINNRKFIQYLVNETGMTNNKSLTLDVTEWFKSISLDNQLSFLRGLFDGDGSICYIKSSDTWTANISTSSIKMKQMLYDFFLSQSCNVKLGKNDVHFNGTNIIKPLSLILSNEGLYMQRKYDKFLEAKKFYGLS